jgi:hypothetical protein
MLWVYFCIGVSNCIYLPILPLHLHSSIVILSSLHLSKPGFYIMCAIFHWVSLHSLLFLVFFWYSVLIYSFNMSRPSQSTFLSLVLYFLHFELSPNVCVNNSVPPGFSHSSHNFISTACSLLFCLLVHAHASAICLKYIYIIILYICQLLHSIINP